MIHLFIVNPFAGSQSFGDKLRKKLASKEGLNYFVFNTREMGTETEFVKQMLHFFRDEKVRLYCCGGSGTFRNCVNGIEDPSATEVAFVSCGLTNDLLKVFGTEQSRFADPFELINGEIMKIDYMQTEHGRAMNTISTGMDMTVSIKQNEYHFLSSIDHQLPYNLALSNAIFLSKPNTYEIEVNGEKICRKSSEIIFGNGNVLGGNLHFSSSSDCTDGLMSYFIGCSAYGIGQLRSILPMLSADYNKLNKLAICGLTDHVKIKRADNVPFPMNFDGEISDAYPEWNIKIVRQGLNFVVPQGLKGGVHHE